MFHLSESVTVAHGKQVTDLPEAIQLSSGIPVKTRTKRQDVMARGNLLADQAAGAATRHTVTVMALVQHEVIPELPETEKSYEDLPEVGKEQWTRLGPLPPERCLLPITCWQREKTHEGAENSALRARRPWAAPGIYVAAERICGGCELCREDAAVRIQPPRSLQLPFLFRNSRLIMQSCQKHWGALTCQ